LCGTATIKRFTAEFAEYAEEKLRKPSPKRILGDLGVLCG
jgi:hypothetical protein